MDIKEKSSYELLRTRAIIDILDGDTEFGEIDDVVISMPYLSGPTIVDISRLFRLSETYGWNGGALSRWNYLDNLLKHGIDTDRIDDILSYLFSKQQFTNKLEGKTRDQFDEIYNYIVKTVIERINGTLSFDGNELTIINRKCKIVPIGSAIKVTTPQVQSIDREYIKDISERAMLDVVNGSYDSAITKSRTLLEEVFCYVIENKNETPTDSGDIGRLYKQVKGLYSMHTDKNLDRRINTLLSGLEKIVSSISEMRNNNSDAHGVGSQRISISEHHARLLVNSAMTMAEFILSVGNNTK